MLTAKKINEQIRQLTINLIEMGLCDAQNFPSMHQYSGGIEEVGIADSDNSVFLKSIPYSEMYKKLIEQKNYNFRMIDGALISLLYRFEGGHLTSHRLSFFPSPNLETFQNEPEIYLEDDLYGDIVDQRIVTVPIRFDYDNRETVAKPIIHPISHCTLGQYEHCRIPVSSALTPYQFMMFITINFYNTAHQKYGEHFRVYHDCFEDSMFREEKSLVHIQCPQYSEN